MALLNDYYSYDSGAPVQPPLVFPENPTQANIDEYYRRLREQNATTQPPGSFDYDPYEYFGSDAFQPTDEFGNDLPYDEMMDWYYNNPDAQGYIDDYWAGGNGDLNPNPDQPPPVDSGPSAPDAGQPPAAPPPERGWDYDWATGGAPGGPNWPEFSNTDDPFEMAQQDRMQAQAWGDLLDQGYRDSQNTYQNLEGGFRDQAQSGPGGYGGILAGEGGFDAGERGDILQEDMLRSGMAGDAEFDENFLSPEEIAAMYGDPYAARDMASGKLGYLDQWLREGDAAQRGAVSALDTDLNASVDPAKLGLSDEYRADFNFGQADADLMADQAGRIAGTNAMARDQQLRDAAFAHGNTSPIALEAARGRNSVYGDIAAADAITDARLKGKGLMLDVASQREAARLGTERDLSGRQRDNASEIRQTQLATEKGLSDAWNDYGRYNTNLMVDTTGQAETAAANRAGGLATNRQGINQGNINTRFGQAGTASTALSGRYGNIYSQKKQEEAEGRGYLTGQQDRAQAGSQAAQDRRSGIYGTRLAGLTNATGKALTAKALPSGWDKAAGFAGALLSGASKSAGG